MTKHKRIYRPTKRHAGGSRSAYAVCECGWVATYPRTQAQAADAYRAHKRQAEAATPCPACGGAGGAQITRFWGRGPNECYPDYEDCPACDGRGEFDDPIEAAQAHALLEDEARTEAAWEAEYEAWEIAQHEAGNL